MAKYTQHESEFSYTEAYPNMVEFEKPDETCVRVDQRKGKLSTDGKPLLSKGFSKCTALLLRNESTLETALFHIDDVDLNHTQLEVVYQLTRNYINSLKIDDEEKKALLSATYYVCKYWNPHQFDPEGGLPREKFVAMNREEFQKRMERRRKEGGVKSRVVVCGVCKSRKIIFLRKNSRAIKACFIMGAGCRNIKNRVVGSLLRYLGVRIEEDIWVDTGEYHWDLVYKPKEATIYVAARSQKKVLTFTF